MKKTVKEKMRALLKSELKALNKKFEGRDVHGVISEIIGTIKVDDQTINLTSLGPKKTKAKKKPKK